MDNKIAVATGVILAITLGGAIFSSSYKKDDSENSKAERITSMADYVKKERLDSLENRLRLMEERFQVVDILNEKVSYLQREYELSRENGELKSLATQYLELREDFQSLLKNGGSEQPRMSLNSKDIRGYIDKITRDRPRLAGFYHDERHVNSLTEEINNYVNAVRPENQDSFVLSMIWLHYNNRKRIDKLRISEDKEDSVDKVLLIKIDYLRDVFKAAAGTQLYLPKED